MIPLVSFVPSLFTGCHSISLQEFRVSIFGSHIRIVCELIFSDDDMVSKVVIHLNQAFRIKFFSMSVSTKKAREVELFAYSGPWF